jgi:hypothetical protein
MTDPQPTPSPTPERDWGVAWFGQHAQSGTCHRCQRADLVFQGYNGGAHMGVFCSACKGPVLAGRPSVLFDGTVPEFTEEEAAAVTRQLSADMLHAQRYARIPVTWRSDASTNPWVVEIPEPVMHRLWLRCVCGRHFWTLAGYQGHYALRHVIDYPKAARDV